MTAALDQAAGLGPLLIIVGVWLCICAVSAVALLLLARDAITEPDHETDPERVDANREECNRLSRAFLTDDEAQWEVEMSAHRRRVQ